MTLSPSSTCSADTLSCEVEADAWGSAGCIGSVGGGGWLGAGSAIIPGSCGAVLPALLVSAGPPLAGPSTRPAEPPCSAPMAVCSPPPAPSACAYSGASMLQAAQRADSSAAARARRGQAIGNISHAILGPRAGH